MHRHLLAVAFAALVAVPLPAQSDEEDVLAVVHRLLDALHAKDREAILATADTAAQLVRFASRDDVEFVRRTQWTDFARSVGEIPADREIEELIWDPEVRVDGNLATVWTPYVVLVNGEISHCGVDAFQLMRFSHGWKIIHIADTARREGCEVPDNAR